jgi:cysteine desulfurase
MPDSTEESIYLDWNATTPPHPAVVEAMRDALTTSWGNPASVHRKGRAARSLVENARERLAQAIQVDARDIVFTSGGTEANNLALHAAPCLVTSHLEHPSVIRVAERLEAQGRAVWLSVSEQGTVSPDELGRLLQGCPQGSWVAVMAANHETGVLQPIAELAAVTHRYGARLHVDAVQALGKIGMSFCAAADSLAVCAHKLRGPRGIGALAWRHGGGPAPLVLGGAQERGLRPGSQDAALAVGFQTALEHADIEAFGCIAALRDRLEAQLAHVSQRNGTVNGRLAHVSNLSFPGWRADELVAALDLAGICVSAGSACSAGTIEPSPVITHMLGEQRAASAVRFSLGGLTSQAEVNAVVSALLRLVSKAGADP